MEYIFETLNIDRLRYLLQLRGMSEREFSKRLWGSGTHRNFKYFGQKPDVKCSTLVKICTILKIPMDSLFSAVDTNGDIPSIVGNDNIVNSSIIGSDISRLKHENETLKLLVKEKDARIEDLKKVNDAQLNLLLNLGQISDK